MNLLKEIKIKGETKTYTEKVTEMENVKEIILKDGNKILFEMPDIDLDEINCSYNGKSKICRCGCAGTYSYLENTRERASKDRGYEIKDDEIKPQSVKFIINKLKNEAKRGIEVIDNYIYSLDIENRTYTLYLLK